MLNNYKIQEGILIIYDRRDNKEILFDAEDFDLLTQYTWHISSSGYAHNRKLKIWAHRLIMNPPKSLFIDHIDHNKLNNRKSNLRIVTREENNQNNKAKGYSWDKGNNRWRAQIGLNGKTKLLGLYKTESEARQAYLEAKKIYHPTAPINYI